jgi:histidinol-phosphate aminotransferase
MALQDTEFADMVRNHTISWRERVRDGLIELGLNVPPSVTNFLLVQFPEGKGLSALQASNFLSKNGILLRPTGVSGPDDCLRVTIGADHENEAFLEKISAYVNGG